MKKLAVVQVRGIIGLNNKLKDTLKFLNLVRKNSCSLVDDDKNCIGMLIKLKDYITWGEIDLETYKQLLEKRGRVAGGKSLTEDYLKKHANMGISDFAKTFFEGKIKVKQVPGLKKFFRLAPPRGGFDKEGVKTPYSLGGALGYRGNKINDLIRRML